MLAINLPCVEARDSGGARSGVTAVVARGVTVRRVIAPGDSFAAVLAEEGVSAPEMHRWYQAARSEMDLRRIAVGHALTIVFSEDRHLRSVRYDIDDVRRLVLEKTGSGGVAVRTETLPVHVEVVGLRGMVHSSFYRAAKHAGMPDPVISSMVDLLGWQVDFGSEVRRGDRFRVLYEQRTRSDGRLLKPGRVLAADFIGRVQSAAAFLYETEQGEASYVDAEGHAIEGAFLRYPLEFTRITSTFSTSRFHPILKKRRPHLGVDFAAPSGTPVRAVGPGRVRWAARKGGLGRHVEIDHGGRLISAYSHLRGIHRAVRRRTRVKRGQIIGYVGRSGLATGTHLHFAMFENGRYVNPLKLHRPPRPTRVIDPVEWEQVRTRLAGRLRTVPGSCQPASSTPPIVLSAFAQARHLGPVILTL